MLLGFKYQLRWISSIVNGYKWRMFLFFLLEVLSIVTTLLFIYYSKKTIDVALKVLDGSVDYLLALVVFYMLIGVLFRSLSQWINQRTQIDMTLGFQYRILKGQMLSVWSVIKKWDTGDLMVRLNSDSTEIVQMLSTTWISFVITCIKILASFFFLYSMDNMLAIVILGITPLFLLAKFYFKKMRALNAKVKQAESEIGSATQENLRNRIMLRALGVLKSRLNSYRAIQDRSAVLRYKYLNFTFFSQGMIRSAMSVGYLVAFGWGIYKLQSMTITFGTMTAFLQLVNQIQSPILTIGSFFPSLVRFRVAVDRVKEISDVEQEAITKNVRFPNIDSISLESVCFKYEEELIINNLSAVFRKGEITAVLGASGKGKTTIIRLLLGLIKPNEGNIYINSDEETVILDSDHIENFSYVPQGNTLLKGTIRENITLGLAEVSEESINEVLYLSCAEFVQDLPDGLNTKVGESGMGLSEGQAQRIAIARAILRDRKVWLFDEATSALDQSTTELLLSRMKGLIKDKIIVFVTHDQNVASVCDNKLYMS